MEIQRSGRNIQKKYTRCLNKYLPISLLSYTLYTIFSTGFSLTALIDNLTVSNHMVKQNLETTSSITKR